MTASASRLERWHGHDEPPPATRELRAGRLSAVLEGIDLRYVRVPGAEVVRRLFVAVRDDSWGTIAPTVDDLRVDESGDSFRITFEAFHDSGPIRFRWRGELTGRDGVLDCMMDGTAESDFAYNRIGFCVLHPMEHAGSRYRARTPDGELEGVLPVEIGAQRIEDGKLWPLFPSYDRLELDLGTAGLVATFEFEGDLFEMEDQRNWTDASFKTYSTPLALPWPHRARAGQKIVQRVRIEVAGGAGAAEEGGGVRIELGDTVATLPAIGLGLTPGAPPEQRELLAALRPAHLRVELRLGGGWEEELENALDASRALGAPLELALFAEGLPVEELDELARQLQGADVVRVLAFREGTVVTEPELVVLVRERLAAALPGTPVGGGTDSWFVDLNRTPPDTSGFDVVAYSICATVHADDDTSVRETASAQGDTVRSARALTGLPVAVGPVTIRPRSWPHGVLDESLLPFQVDRRQLSLFGAAWTVASAKYLAEAGADSVTYYETEGWRGVVERRDGNPTPDVFRSRPGQAFPLYHVLRDLGEAAGAEVVEARSSRPLDVAALALRADGGVDLLLLANLTPQEQEVELAGAGGPFRLRRLDEESYEEATLDPESFRGRFEDAAQTQPLLLRPYEVVRIDSGP